MAMRRLALFAIVVGILAAAPGAQQLPPRTSPPQFRTGVEVVEVDVSVLDAKRRPVRGLVASDFTVLEDGKPQEILSFTPIDVAPAVPAPEGWLRDVSPDTRTNLAGADRLTVLVLDDGQVRPMPRHVQNVKAMARAVVDRLGPNDLMAIVFTRDNSAAQPFTNDRQLLLKSIDGFTSGSVAGMPAIPGDRGAALASGYFAEGSLITLRYVAESLRDATQRRKTVFYISPGVYIDGSDELRREANLVIERAKEANVNVYGLDPSGLGGLDAEDTVATLGATQRMANDLLHVLAVNTGGRALVNRNEVVSGVGEVFDENASYYLVGYRSSNTSTSTKFRRIEVRVDRPGVTVRARSGYRGARTSEKDKGGASPALIKAMSDSAPKGDVAMQMTAAPFANPDKKDATVALAIALRQPRLSLGGSAVEYINMIVGAYEPDGKRGPSERLNARIVLKQTDDPFVHYELLTRLQMAPGRYQLRVAAESALYAKEGSLHYDVEIPDFTKGDLNLSGVLLSVEPNIPVAGRERLGAVVPVLPTSRREFWPGDNVSAFVRVYQKKGATDPVKLTLQVRDAESRKVFERTDTIATTLTVSLRSADYGMAIPLNVLPPGPYLLTIEATSGKTSARRDVRMIRR
jgi:VWFA-related protein